MSKLSIFRSRSVPFASCIVTALCAFACDDAAPSDDINQSPVSVPTDSAAAPGPSSSASGTPQASTSNPPAPTNLPATNTGSNTSGTAATPSAPRPTSSTPVTSPSASGDDNEGSAGGAEGSDDPTTDDSPNGQPTDMGTPDSTASSDDSDVNPLPTDSEESDPPTADTGADVPASGERTSAGCGMPTSLESGAGTIDVDGTEREYFLEIPSDYDPARPYKLIFGLHWMGGQASDVATGGTVGLGNYYGLEELAEGSAIFVSPNGIDNGWANTGGRDIALMKALIARINDGLCIDLDRVFSVGFSYGGMMSFAIACEMADVFRAVAPLSGALYSGCGNGTEPVAMWGAHGLSDEVVPIDDGRSGLQEVLDRNHCGSETSAVEPSPCVTYSGCDEGYPVTWCEFDGGHGPQRWQVQPIWDFFSQF